MPRRNHGTSKHVTVSREVIALAAIASYRATLRREDAQTINYLPGRVFGSRRITRRMARALKAQAA